MEFQSIIVKLRFIVRVGVDQHTLDVVAAWYDKLKKKPCDPRLLVSSA